MELKSQSTSRLGPFFSPQSTPTSPLPATPPDTLPISGLHLLHLSDSRADSDLQSPPIASSSSMPQPTKEPFISRKLMIPPTRPMSPISSENETSPFSSPEHHHMTLPNPSSPSSPRKSARGGAEWRIVTRIREEQRGRRTYLVEEQAWQYFTAQELKLQKKRAKEEAIELNRMTRVDGRSRENLARGYFSEGG